MTERLDIRADQVRPRDHIRRGDYTVVAASTSEGRTYLDVGGGITFSYLAAAVVGVKRPRRNPPAETVAVGLLRKMLDGMYHEYDHGSVLLDGEVSMDPDEAQLVAELLLELHPEEG